MDQVFSSKDQQIASLMRSQGRSVSRWLKNDPDAPMIVGTTAVQSMGPIDYTAETRLVFKATMQEAAALISDAIDTFIESFPEESAETMTAHLFAMICGTLEWQSDSFVLAQMAIQARDTLGYMESEPKKSLKHARAVSEAMWKWADEQRDAMFRDDNE